MLLLVEVQKQLVLQRKRGVIISTEAKLVGEEGQPGEAPTSFAAWLPSTAAPSFPCFTYCPFILNMEERDKKFAFRNSAVRASFPWRKTGTTSLIQTTTMRKSEKHNEK